MNRITVFFMMLVVAVMMAVPVSAQDSAEEKELRKERENLEAAVRAAEAAREEALRIAEAATKKEFKIYEIKHRTAKSMVSLLPPSIGYVINEEFNAISVEAGSEMHEVVASILKKYDVPKRTIQFQFFMVKASNSDDAAESIADLKKAGLPEKALTALNEVAGLTRYKNFKLITAPTILTREGTDATFMELGEDGYLRNKLELHAVEVAGVDRIRINKFKLNFQIPPATPPAKYSEIEINTALEFSRDEPVVIGTSQVGNDDISDISVITIVTAQIVSAD